MIKGARDYCVDGIRDGIHLMNHGEALKNIQAERDQLKKLEIENLKNEIMEL